MLTARTLTSTQILTSPCCHPCFLSQTTAVDAGVDVVHLLRVVVVAVVVGALSLVHLLIVVVVVVVAVALLHIVLVAVVVAVLVVVVAALLKSDT